MKDDRNCRGRRLGRKRRGVPLADDHGDLTADQIGRQSRQASVLALRPAIFDRHVAALDVAGFVQALAERAHDGPSNRSGDVLPRNPTTGIAGCCARAAIGHAAAAPPEQREIPAAACLPRGSGDSIVSAQTSALIGLKPASRLQYEMLADVRFGSWPCKNSLGAGRSGLREWGLRFSGQFALIAAMSGWMPMMFMTRVRL